MTLGVRPPDPWGKALRTLRDPAPRVGLRVSPNPPRRSKAATTNVAPTNRTTNPPTM